jgi:hypothetical protein
MCPGAKAAALVTTIAIDAPAFRYQRRSSKNPAPAHQRTLICCYLLEFALGQSILITATGTSVFPLSGLVLPLLMV